MGLARKLAIEAFRPRPPKGEMTTAELDAVRRLLIVRAHDQLGDFLLATPAIAALRKRFSAAEITLVVNQFLAPLALENPDVNRVVVAPWSRSPVQPFQLLSLKKDLAGKKDHAGAPFDLALVLNTVSHSLTSDVIARISGASRVAGPSRPSLKDSERAPLYDWVYEPAEAISSHQMARGNAVVVPLGCEATPVGYRFAHTPEEDSAARQRASALPPGRLIGLHIGTRDAAKRYPLDAWVLFVNKIAAQGDAHWVIFDAPDARGETQALHSRLKHEHTMLPPLSLREGAALLKVMSAVVCHDSAFLHLAAAVGTPTLSVHGRGAVEDWKPPGQEHRALQAADSLPASVTVAEMITNLDSLLVESADDRRKSEQAMAGKIS